MLSRSRGGFIAAETFRHDRIGFASRFGARHPRQFAAFTPAGETLAGETLRDAPLWNQPELPQAGLAPSSAGTRLASIAPADGPFNAVHPIRQGRRHTRPQHSNVAQLPSWTEATSRKKTECRFHRAQTKANSIR